MSAHSLGYLVPAFHVVEIHYDFANQAMPSQVKTPESERLLSFYEVYIVALGKIQQGNFSSDGSSLLIPTHTAAPSLWFAPGEPLLGEKLLQSSELLPAFVLPIKTQGQLALLPNNAQFTWKSQNTENSQGTS